MCAFVFTFSSCACLCACGVSVRQLLCLSSFSCSETEQDETETRSTLFLCSKQITPLVVIYCDQNCFYFVRTDTHTHTHTQTHTHTHKHTLTHTRTHTVLPHTKLCVQFAVFLQQMLLVDSDMWSFDSTEQFLLICRNFTCTCA